MNDGWGTFSKIATKWILLDLSDDKSTLVQSIVWYCQTTSHYPSQRWPRSMSTYSATGPQWVNSLAPGRFEWNFMYVIFKQILEIDVWGIFCRFALIWMPLDNTDDLSKLGQVMAWCRQATSHYLSQCWPRSLSPHDVTRPQWVNTVALSYLVISFSGYILIDICLREQIVDR